MVGLDTMFGAGALAALGTLLFVFVIITLAVYIYMAIALMAIAKKTKTKNGWLAFIPIANIYLMTQIAKVSGWWTLIILAAWVPFIGGLAVTAVTIYLWWLIAERVGKPGWWGILMIIPIVNFIIIGLLAWGKK